MAWALLWAWLVLFAATALAGDGPLDAGQRFLDRGKYEQALEKAEEALARDGAHAKAHNLRAWALYGLGLYEEAYKAFDNVRESAGDDAVASVARTNMAKSRHAIALLHFQGEKYAKALKQIEKALQADPAYVSGLLFLGNVFEALGRRDDAREAYEKAVKQAPRDSLALYNLGRFLVQINDYDAAASVFQTFLAKVKDMIPEQAYAHYAVGVACRAAFDYPKALSHFQKALDLAPEMKEAQIMRDEMTLSLGKIRKTSSAERNLVFLALAVLAVYGAGLWLFRRWLGRIGEGPGGEEEPAQEDG
jgi:tetratricopeptide (TPR) repeat protein